MRIQDNKNFGSGLEKLRIWDKRPGSATLLLSMWRWYKYLYAGDVLHNVGPQTDPGQGGALQGKFPHISRPDIMHSSDDPPKNRYRYRYIMDQISVKTPNPKGWLFLKIYQ
jgi:hypothetical protein